MKRGLAILACCAFARLGAQQPHVAEQSSGVTATLMSVSAVDMNVVWVGASNGSVLRTTNGGDAWERHPVPGAERLQFRGIHGLNPTEAWAMSSGNGADSRIYHTTDGGSTWTLQFTNADSAAFFDCITFFDAKHGVAYGDAARDQTTILRTADGGAHWALLPAAAVPAALTGEGAFASSNSCAISIDKRRGFIAASEPGARIFSTIDAGATWKIAAAATPFVHDKMAGITALSFRDASHGIGVAARINNAMQRDTASAAVATTDDGGKTWTLRARPAKPGSLSGVALVPKAGKNVAVIASYGGLFVSTDGAATWTTLTTFGYWAVRAAGRRAWAVGTGGRISRVDF